MGGNTVKKDITGSNNVCVRAKYGVYCVLFSRGLNKPHLVVCKTDKGTAESLRLGWLRAIRMAKSQNFTFRTNSAFIKMVQKDRAQLTDLELEVLDMIKEKQCVLMVREELAMFNDIMDAKMDKKIARAMAAQRANAE